MVMVARYVVCEFGTLRFEMKGEHWNICLKQAGRISYIESCRIPSDGMQSLDGLLPVFIRSYGLGGIKDDFIRIRFPYLRPACFNVYKTSNENLLWVSYTPNGCIYSTAFVYADFYDIKGCLAWCNALLNSRRAVCHKPDPSVPR